MFPFVQTDREQPYRYRDLHDQVAAAGLEQGFHVLDATDAFWEEPPNRLWVAADPHPSPRAHAIVARLLHAKLVGAHDEFFDPSR